MLLVFFLIIRRPPRSTRPYTLFPNTTPFRSYRPPKTSLGVFARQPGYAGDLDALVLQRLGIGVRCLAIDASRIGLAVVDLARLFSEVLADVVAVLLHVTAQLAQQAAQLAGRSEEHTSELQSLMRISYDVFCLKKKKQNKDKN